MQRPRVRQWAGGTLRPTSSGSKARVFSPRVHSRDPAESPTLPCILAINRVDYASHLPGTVPAYACFPGANY